MSLLEYTPLVVDYTHGDAVAAKGLGAGTVLYIIWTLVTRKRVIPSRVVVDHDEEGVWQYDSNAVRLVHRSMLKGSEAPR